MDTTVLGEPHSPGHVRHCQYPVHFTTSSNITTQLRFSSWHELHSAPDHAQLAGWHELCPCMGHSLCPGLVYITSKNFNGLPIITSVEESNH